MSVQSKKRCPRCGEWKPLREFAQDKTAEDGLYNACYDCFDLKDRKALNRKEFTGAWYFKIILIVAGAVAILSMLEEFMEKMPSWFPLLIPLGIMVGVGIVRWFKYRD